jgi:environmental stress-induced protein Ves
MINIITPEEFKTIPWKNGNGETTELAISKGGDIHNFDWRLSIATIEEDGAFSNFTGYERNLILLEGNGVELIHDNQKELLEKPLTHSCFNGSSKTIGKLIDGPILDFNLITKEGKYKVEVISSVSQQEYTINRADMCFVYSHQSYINLKIHNEVIVLPTGYLAMNSDFSEMYVNGANVIVITLRAK